MWFPTPRPIVGCIAKVNFIIKNSGHKIQEAKEKAIFSSSWQKVDIRSKLIWSIYTFMNKNFTYKAIKILISIEDSHKNYLLFCTSYKAIIIIFNS